MCTAFALAAASLAMTAGSAAMEFSAQSKAADTQTEMYNRNAQSAREAQLRNYNEVMLRQQQETQVASQEIGDAAREARAAVATNRVAAGEAGITGLSVDALLADIYGESAGYRDRVNQQTEWTLNQLQREQEGIRAETTDRINSVQPGQRPSFVSLGLKLGQAGLDSYSMYRGMKAGQPTSTTRSWTSAGTSAGRIR